VEQVIGGAQKVSTKREPYTVGQEFGRREEGVGWSYRSVVEDKFLQPHIQEYGVFPLVNTASPLVFLDVSYPAVDVACVHSMFGSPAIDGSLIDSQDVQASEHVYIGKSRGGWTMTKAATIIMDSFFCISAIDSLMHWSIFRSAQYTCIDLLTLKYQSFHPLVGLGQDQNVSFHRFKEKFWALKGILLASALIKSVGSGSPIGHRHWKCGWSVGITSLLHSF
jgi:hypothetical protein